MAASRVRFLGTGNAFNSDGRGSASLWIEPPRDTPFLVDIGPTAMSAMERLQLDCSALDRLFLTHLHGDHVAGWPFLMLHLVFRHRRERRFEVYGPPGTRRCLEGLCDLSYAEILDRREFDVVWHEIPVEEADGMNGGPGLRLDVVPMEHTPTSIGLRFEIDGKRLAVSGDTRWCRALERLAAPSDLSIIECTTISTTEVAHVSLEELREGRDRLNDGRVVLVHLSDDVAEALARDPLRDVTAAYDGLVVEL